MLKPAAIDKFCCREREGEARSAREAARQRSVAALQLGAIVGQILSHCMSPVLHGSVPSRVTRNGNGNGNGNERESECDVAAAVAAAGRNVAMKCIF